MMALVRVLDGGSLWTDGIRVLFIAQECNSLVFLCVLQSNFNSVLVGVAIGTENSWMIGDKLEALEVVLVLIMQPCSLDRILNFVVVSDCDHRCHGIVRAGKPAIH